MTVYVDNARIPYYSMKVSHLAADTDDELIDFALKLGLNLKWIQNNKPFTHFDVSLSYRKKAIELGAVPVTTIELVTIKMKSLIPTAPGFETVREFQSHMDNEDGYWDE